MRKKKLTLDNNTTASNPGSINFKPMIWIKHDLETVIPFVVALVFFIILSFVYSYFWLVIVLFILAKGMYYFVSIKEHFTADSNLGVVVSKKPLLLAVYTDLTKGNGHYPVIKIIDYKGSKDVLFGEKIGTISTYSQSDEESFLYREGGTPYWVNFYPFPVTYATDDQKEIQQTLSTYPEGQKELIMDCVKQLPKPYKKGLYRVNIQNSDWPIQQ